nr:hypothetical protein [Pedobacter panaciterrae]
MPWYNGDYPPSYKNLPVKIRDKAVEIANAILEESGDEVLAIATGVKQAKVWAKKEGVASNQSQDKSDKK